MTQTESANVSKSQLRPGLTLVATPIGNARDLTLRAIDALRDADVIACEDTRVARRLMELHGVALDGRPLLSYHEHNAEETLPRLIALMREGRRLIYLSDAGTPLIADPGFRLARAAIAEGLTLSATPGPCAAVMALTLSNLPSDRFTFVGFPPPKSGQRRRVFQELAAVPSTLIFYESPRRLPETLAEMAEIFGERDAAVARELTKAFEQVRRGRLPGLAAHYREAGPPKGEVVILLGPPQEPERPPEAVLDEALETALRAMSVRDAARAVADALNMPRKAVYERALALRRDKPSRDGT